MSFPPALQEAIDAHLARHRLPDLAAAAERLTDRYRTGARGHRDDAETWRAAYIATRMPATFAAISRVMERLLESAPDAEPRTMLDLGTGPGTALWAAAEVFHTLESAVALDRDAEMIALARELSADLGPSVEWREGDAAGLSLPKADLVVAAYALNELPQSSRDALIDSAWAATERWLVVVEPGTPAAFKGLLHARTRAIELGAHVLAPCPHDGKCPMGHGEEWCHFPERLSRTRTHRLVKQADLGYEDEKYSYVILAREAPAARASRIIANPRVSKAEVRFDVCTAEGLREERVPRRSGEDYKRAKKLDWGDAWE